MGMSLLCLDIQYWTERLAQPHLQNPDTVLQPTIWQVPFAVKHEWSRYLNRLRGQSELLDLRQAKDDAGG
jgi:hypothetical protein